MFSYIFEGRLLNNCVWFYSINYSKRLFKLFATNLSFNYSAERNSGENMACKMGTNKGRASNQRDISTVASPRIWTMCKLIKSSTFKKIFHISLGSLFIYAFNLIIQQFSCSWKMRFLIMGKIWTELKQTC